MTAPFILCALVTAISAIISLGFSIAAALGATDTARTMALYACARSMALMIVSAVPFLSGSIEWIAIEAGCAGPALHAKLLGGGSTTLLSAFGFSNVDGHRHIDGRSILWACRFPIFGRHQPNEHDGLTALLHQ
jgi:hypothetical protein